MDQTLARVHAEEWGPAIEKEALRCICRFLIGRTAMDCSVLVNFLRVEAAGSEPGLESNLLASRFRPVSASGLPAELHAKQGSKIPTYATELDTCCAAYYGRVAAATAKPTAKPSAEVKCQHEAVAGHEDSMHFEGEAVWKREQKGQRG